MPYWLHDNKLTYATRSLSSIKRLLITLGILFVIVIGWYFAWQLTFSKHSSTLREKLAGAQAEKQSIKKIEHKLLALQQQKETLKKQCQTLYNDIPDYQKTLDELFMLADKYKLLSKGAEKIQENQDELIKFHTIEMSLRGAFLDLISFYTAVARKMPHIGITACSFKQSKKRRVTMRSVLRITKGVTG